MTQPGWNYWPFGTSYELRRLDVDRIEITARRWFQFRARNYVVRRFGDQYVWPNGHVLRLAPAPVWIALGVALEREGEAPC